MRMINSSCFCGLEHHSQTLVSGSRHDLCSRVTSAGNECLNDSSVARAFKDKTWGIYCEILVRMKEVQVQLCSASPDALPPGLLSANMSVHIVPQPFSFERS